MVEKKKLNLVSQVMDKNAQLIVLKDFKNDEIAFIFYLGLLHKYSSLDETFPPNCYNASKYIKFYGIPESPEKLKKITDKYFKGELDKSILDMLLDCLNKNELPKGVML